uniref:Carbamoyltransferase n=1 Tax=Candidatus Kentrum sp. FW TaxID=2126338 RepID=A0A450T6N5_9GAMM|nr:MAG: carbamoyltransferase [Candidatus Kentron sp. FW]VFJ62356.1 MAG: carbamoyltransferase [Candidatus Kentron sp. FW]
MYVIGINSVFHESAACLLKDGVILAAAEEERFNRIKHGKKPSQHSPDELPRNAIGYCLESAGIALEAVDYIGYSFNPEKMPKEPFHDLFLDGDKWGGQAGLQIFCESIYRAADALKTMGFRGEVKWIDHHTAHGASAFYASPFQDAAVLVIDGIGETNSAELFSGRGNRLNSLQAISYPASVGLLWELVSHFLGFSVYDAAKVMGLAAYGNPQRYLGHFEKVVKLVPNGQCEMDNTVLPFGGITYDPPWANCQGLEILFGFDQRARGQELTGRHEDIAASLQVITDRIIRHVTEHLYEIAGSENLCLAGGVTLNCIANRVAFEQTPFSRLFVQPAAHDAGTALGAASFIWHHLLGNESRQPMTHAYLGPSFTNVQIEKGLQAHGLDYRYTDRIEREVAELIAQGHIVGFFQGGMEIGPRALGNRSLLADPRHPDMREILNRKVKHREYFRPLAPSILQEEVGNWFKIEKETSASDFMLMAYPVKPSCKEKIPAVVHVDGTSRIQTVRKDANPRYHKLISEFQRLTGVPIVLNTSFNDSEPIVCTPKDAINTFLKTRIDYLALGDFLVGKTDNWPRGGA